MAAAGFSSEAESRAAHPGAECQEPAKAAKTGLGARLGPKMWERPLDGFNAPRAAPGWLPRTPAGARVPMLSLAAQDVKSQKSDYFADFSEALPATTRPWRALGTTDRAIFAPRLKTIKTGRAKLPKRRATTASISAKEPRAVR